MKKIWKDIIGYEGLYQISNYGEIRCMRAFNKNGKIIKNYVRSGKSRFLSKDGKKKHIHIPRLVAEYFVPNPEPKNKDKVLHKDFNPDNNKASNLKWSTNSEIINYSISKGRVEYKTGEDHHMYGSINLGITGENNHNCKLTDKQVLQIRKRYANGETQVKLSRIYGVSQFNISRIVNMQNRTLRSNGNQLK